MLRLIYRVALYLAFPLLFSSCASLTGFQDGRSAGQNKADLSASINYAQSPDFTRWKKAVEDSMATDIPTLYFPNVEIGGRYGILENLDVRMTINSTLNLNFGVKYQLLGGKNSPYAFAVGADVGTFALVSGLWNIQIPLYFSVHPIEKFTWYISPRYIRQFSSYTGASYGLNYLGGNTGLMWGKRHKIGLDVGYYSIGITKLTGNIGMIQVGIGARFALNREKDTW